MGDLVEEQQVYNRSEYIGRCPSRLEKSAQAAAPVLPFMNTSLQYDSMSSTSAISESSCDSCCWP
jgi:hypothetical protein